MSNIDIKFKNTPKILGLDISTKTIGFALFNLTGSKLLELTHFSPKIKPQPEDKIEELIKKAEAFKKHLYLMPLHVASIKTSLGIKGGSRRQTKRNKFRKAVRKSNKRIQRK